MFGGGGECGASLLLQEEEVSERASRREELRELSEGLQSCVAGTHEKAVVYITSLRSWGTRVW